MQFEPENDYCAAYYLKSIYLSSEWQLIPMHHLSDLSINVEGKILEGRKLKALKTKKNLLQLKINYLGKAVDVLPDAPY
ncbi:MAG: hypothetical protein HOO08_00790 [Opitutae bacterium]|jgi:hypothetical protein|nr:hypothetical protein [Opitutae bacterium]